MRWHVYTQFEHMFTPCWKTCLHIVWNMFTQYSKTYLYRVERNSYSMLEDLILLGLIIMHLHNVWRQFSIIFENMLTQYLETFFLHHVRTYVMSCMKNCWHNISSMFEDVFIQCWQTCLHKIDDICYKFVKSFSLQSVQNGVNCWKWMKILKCLFKTFATCVVLKIQI